MISRTTRWLQPSFVLTAAVSLACAGLSSAPSTTDMSPGPSVTGASPQSTPTRVPPTSMPAATPTQPLADTLSQTGPWLLINTTQGLYAANADGSAFTQLTSAPAAAPHDLRAAVAPNGGRAAFVYSEPGVGLTLHLISLPGGADQTLATLRPQIINGSDGSRDEVSEAILKDGSLAWSPDGTMLAFVGAISGPSADVYLYKVTDGSITELTSGASQAYQLSWSRDGKYILHAGANGFGTGAGYDMAGVWAAPVDGSDVKTLYVPKGGGEQFVGWIAPATFLTYTWDVMCGPHDLRAVDIESGQENTRVSSYFDGDGIALDPATTTVVYSVDSVTAGCTAGASAGTFRFNWGELGTTLSSSSVARNIEFVPQIGSFFGQTDTGVIEITTGGVATEYASPIARVPLISPDGRFWAWHSDGFATSPGLWVMNFHDTGAAPIIGDTVPAAIWSPDSQYLFFVWESRLMRLDSLTQGQTQVGPLPLDVTDEHALAWVVP